MPIKRIVSAALALLLAVSFAAPSGVQAISASDGNAFEYTLTGSAATVTGCTGTCPTTLVIPGTLDGYLVTAIGYSAFGSMPGITPQGDRLTSVTIPNSVTTISDRAFFYNLLTSVTIPDSVTTIGVWAFSSNNLTTVTIPNSVTSIGIDAFYSNDLTSVTIGNSVASIGDTAFEANALTSVTIPSSVTSIGIQAFGSNSLTTVTFLGDAPTDGGAVFAGNTGLTSVTRPYAATGWSSTWGGKPVVTAAGPTPTPTPTPTPAASPNTRAAAAVKPTVSGTSAVGKTLTAAKGTWTGSPTPTFTYQWYACTKTMTAARATVPSTCKKITRATKSTFKLTATQRGKYVAVVVTGTSLGTTATTWLSKTTAKVK